MSASKPPLRFFDVPPTEPPVPCRGCGSLVYWIVTAAGKRMPCDADGVSHLATCPDAARFRKRKAGQ